MVKPGFRKKSYSRLCFFRWPSEVVVGEGEKSALKLSTGTLAKLADGAAVAQVVLTFSTGGSNTFQKLYTQCLDTVLTLSRYCPDNVQTLSR